MKDGAQHTSGIAITNMKKVGTSVNCVDSLVNVNTSTLKVDDIPYSSKSDERRNNDCARLSLLKPQPFGGRSLLSAVASGFPQWQMAFETLMSQDNVNDTQQIMNHLHVHYLKDSLSGPALECIKYVFYLIHSMLILLL